MGYVSLPERPPPGGRLRCSLDLNTQELRVMVDLLHSVANVYINSRAHANSAVPASAAAGGLDATQHLPEAAEQLQRLSIEGAPGSALLKHPHAAAVEARRADGTADAPAQHAPQPPAQPAWQAVRPASTPTPGAPQPPPPPRHQAAAPSRPVVQPQPPAPQAVRQPAPQPPPQQPQRQPPQQPPPQQPPQRPQQRQPPQPAQPVRPPQPAPARAAQAPAQPMRPVQVQPPHQPAQRPQPHQPPSAPARHAAPRAAPPAPPPAPTAGRGPSWQCRFTSDASFHNRSVVSALLHVPAIRGLPGGDGHAGWLVSTSRGLLNLWECNAGGGRGIDSLVLMHSQEADFTCTRLLAEPDLALLMAVALPVASGGECVAVHSLTGDSPLAYRYNFAPKGGGIPQRGAQRMFHALASVHTVSPSLTGCMAATYCDKVVVFDANAAVPPGSSVTGARSGWVAHPGSTATEVHRSGFGPHLLSGGADAAIHVWELRAPPRQPLATFRGHSQTITGLHLVNDTCFASCSLDGQVLLWDPRNASQARAACSPDASPCLRLAPSPVGDVLAVSTNRGLHAIDLLDPGCSTQPIAPHPLDRPFIDVTWNVATDELYAANVSGAVSVFARSY